MNHHQLQLLACGLVGVACSAPTDSAPSNNAESLGSAHSTGGGAAGPGNSDVATSHSTRPPPGHAPGPSEFAEDSLIDDSAEPSPSAAPAAAACAGETYEAKRLPLDLYFLVDISGSMAESTPNGLKWDLVSSSLIQFLEDPANAAIGAGIGYFPLDATAACSFGDPDCLCIPFTPICVNLLGGSCDAADYAPSVPLTTPSDAARVTTDIASRMMSGGTPTRPALEGALAYAESWASAHPERKVVVVLATDGEPTGCPSNTPDDIGAVAAAALRGPHQIRTFVVGVGRSLTSLNSIARQGGTVEAFLTDTNEDLAQELGAALRSIRDEAVQCEFEIPTTAGSGRIDAGRVNVRVASASGGSELIPMTADGALSGCGPEGGWHYDNADTPTRITLCEASCQAVQDGASIEIEYGCETIRTPQVR